jgi:hypothetical protein
VFTANSAPLEELVNAPDAGTDEAVSERLIRIVAI